MSDQFRFKRAWSNGIWRALRQVAGVPSPKRFEVQQIPLLANECLRIYAITNRLKDAIRNAGKQTIKRIFRESGDAERVLSEMTQLLDASVTQESHSDFTETLKKWQRADVNKFLQRLSSPNYTVITS
ncbi:hypothetical protein [Candidatus Fukatsuia endosymbiont of Tuberolachnus salignus]|uniref:hypothetical protein n=1 Tax=Candidatus Fukatsuia endosymbiont of Tuberolachnus salignus TaxID=3077957 RepID=UPI00313D3786